MIHSYCINVLYQASERRITMFKRCLVRGMLKPENYRSIRKSQFEVICNKRGRRKHAKNGLYPLDYGDILVQVSLDYSLVNPLSILIFRVLVSSGYAYAYCIFDDIEALDVLNGQLRRAIQYCQRKIKA